MAIKEILEHLNYSKCDCPIDYKEDIGIVNGVCPNHRGSILMVDGIRMEIYLKMVQQRKEVDTSPPAIV